MRRQQGTSLNDVLADIASRLDSKSGGKLSQSKAIRAWEKVAGERVLAHTTGAHLRQGELVIFVDSPAWATELSALSERYREAMAEELGENLARGVRFSVSSRVERVRQEERDEEEGERFYQPDHEEAIELSPEERAQVEASAAVIPDEELREAVVRATVADLQWKKGTAAAKRRQEPRGGS